MTLDQVLNELGTMGNAKAIEIWKKMHISHEVYLGNGITALKMYAKKIKNSHELAMELWETKVHDAKLLATMIEEPKKVTEEQIDKQITEIYSSDLCDKFSSNVVAKSAFAVKKILEWCKDEREYHKRGGFVTLYNLSDKSSTLNDEQYMELLQQIETEIHNERNWVREGMIFGLIGIGKRNEMLRSLVTEACKRIGKIDIDYGNTSCVAPDPLMLLNAKKYKCC
ncbi:MAG: DNA alkylation repair protein [Bacillota bacterium]